MHYYFYKQILKADKISFISRSIKYLKEVHNFFTLYRSNNLGFFLYTYPELNILNILLTRKISDSKTSFTLKTRDLCTEVYTEMLCYFKM